LERARAAHRRAPGLAPATAILAELHFAEGRAGAAAKAIEATWAVAPHPDLARIYVAAETDALARLKRLEHLVQRNPDHVESRLAVADAAITAGLWGEARRWLRPLETGRAPARACRLLAAIELGEKDDMATARAWLERAAASGAPHAAWQCDACRGIQDSWSATCHSCGATGTLAWGEFSLPRVAGLIDAPR
ncbi:MAG: heme biosynthesis protein HemY, partial [Alphaproteobacteria bacterium]